jgi:hypothetical protein
LNFLKKNSDSFRIIFLLVKFFFDADLVNLVKTRMRVLLFFQCLFFKNRPIFKNTVRLLISGLSLYGHLDAINFLRLGKDKILDVMLIAEIELVKSLIRTWTHDNAMPKSTDHYRFLKDITQRVNS